MESLKQIFNNTNDTISLVVGLILIFYVSLAAPKLPKSVLTFLDNTFVKVFLIFLIAYISSKNPTMSLVIAIVFMVTIQGSSMLETKEKLDNVMREHFTDIDQELIKAENKNKELSETLNIIPPVVSEEVMTHEEASKLDSQRIINNNLVRAEQKLVVEEERINNINAYMEKVQAEFDKINQVPVMTQETTLPVMTQETTLPVMTQETTLPVVPVMTQETTLPVVPVMTQESVSTIQPVGDNDIDLYVIGDMDYGMCGLIKEEQNKQPVQEVCESKLQNTDLVNEVSGYDSESQFALY